MKTRPAGAQTVLAVRGFRRLLAVRLSSQFADGLFQAALAGSVVFNPERQTTPMTVAAATAVLMAPYALVGPFVGVFLDRWSRRQVLVRTNLARALLLVPAVLMIASGYQGPLFVLTVLLIIAVNRVFLSAMSAAIPHVVDDPHLVTANSVSGTAGAIFYTSGLGVAIALVNAMVAPGDTGYASIAALAPAGYLASAAMAYRWFSPDVLGPDPEQDGRVRAAAAIAGVGRGLVDGVRHLARRRGAAAAIAAQAAARCLYGVLGLAMLLLYRHYFVLDDDVRDSISALAVVFVAAGAGVLCAAVLTPPVTRRVGGWRWLAGLLCLASVALLAFGLPFRAMLLAAAAFVLNLSAQGIKIVVDTSVQHECHDAYRGRVFSLNDTMFNLTYVAGMFVGALVLPADGHSPAVLIAVAVGLAAVAAAYAAAVRRWIAVEGDDIAGPAHPHHPVDHAVVAPGSR